MTYSQIKHDPTLVPDYKQTLQLAREAFNSVTVVSLSNCRSQSHVTGLSLLLLISRFFVAYEGKYEGK